MSPFEQFAFVIMRTTSAFGDFLNGSFNFRQFSTLQCSFKLSKYC